jgi:hypothetical protein
MHNTSTITNQEALKLEEGEKIKDGKDVLTVTGSEKVEEGRMIEVDVLVTAEDEEGIEWGLPIRNP